LVSSPVDLDFELFVVSCALNLMKNMRTSKYPTSLAQDKKMLAQVVDNWRFKLALIHRINQKEILNDQIRLLAVLLRILARLKEGAPYKDAYCLPVMDSSQQPEEELESTQDEVTMNRLHLRRYLQELKHYQDELF
jgi:hypothetical protein